eukprot:Nk52_evm50s359 gene=Nk52_evmTU50s359
MTRLRFVCQPLFKKWGIASYQGCRFVSLHSMTGQRRSQDGVGLCGNPGTGVKVGTWLSTGNGLVAEALISLGCFNWIAIDTEHSFISGQEITGITQIARSYNVDVIVRVPEPNPLEIRKLLDTGISGIVIPNVKCKEEILHLQEHLFYPPKGIRGCGLSRANQWGATLAKNMNFKPFVMAQIESLEGAENAQSICELDFIDSILIGPYDLSASAGEVANFHSEKFKNAIEKIESACKTTKTPLGIHTGPDINAMPALVQKGYSIISYSYDLQSLRASYQDLVMWKRNQEQTNEHETKE